MTLIKPDPTTPRRGMMAHQSRLPLTNTWLTPPGILTALGDFDLDPCAAPSPRPWPTAHRHIELPEDGLAADWSGQHVWMNPPYGRETGAWLEKLADHGDGIALVFARTETSMFVDQVWSRADAILFLHGRLHFHTSAGERYPTNSGAPSCLVAYGDRAVSKLEDSGLPGTVVPLRRSSPRM